MKIKTSRYKNLLVNIPVFIFSLNGLAVFADPVATNVSMVSGVDNYQAIPVFTVGQSLPEKSGSYTPPGTLDGIGAYLLDNKTVRVLVNHEMKYKLSYEYPLKDINGGTYQLSGARISYFDIDKSSRKIVDAGIAYNAVFDANGKQASDNSFLANSVLGLSRFCSSTLFNAKTYGLHDTIYFTGEEEGGSKSPAGGNVWALDVKNQNLWNVPALGHGAWENITLLDTGNPSQVAVLLADDTAPFDVDDDGEKEFAPLYLYIGTKNNKGDFLSRNGLRSGKLYVWVAVTGEHSSNDFHGSGTISGKWVAIDNTRIPESASATGITGYDKYGYPTQRTLWSRAKLLGAFGFSRPEDIATNPADGSEAVLASTGVSSFAHDSFGTIYRIKTDFKDITSTLTILYNGDVDPVRALRSPDNLDWADDGYIYIQEDMAVAKTRAGEYLFGTNATNRNEAGIVQLDPNSGKVKRIANINRNIVLDASIDKPENAIDYVAHQTGRWESSGILDVSKLFDQTPGTLFLLDVQAHGIVNQPSPSRITNDDLVEGGQLLFLIRGQKGSE